MKIHYYGYNAFVVETDDKVLAIDPGALFFYWFRFPSLLPKSRWQDITHIFITHGDPDHYWYADKIADMSGAHVFMSQTMLRDVNGQNLALGPRSKGLSFTTSFDNLSTLTVGQTIEVDGMKVTGVRTTHGELLLKLGPFRKMIKPGPQERIGWGAIGFDIQINGKRLLNLGDTLFHEKEWKNFIDPDVLMIPIGGRFAHNTMDEMQAIEAVKLIRPKLVIPCHYNCPGLFSKKLNPAEVDLFKQEVEAMGIGCNVMNAGECVHVC